eukprot:CAMPEP_0202872914 /NCGR_PEP_ID=MMETSP1391-20130828/22260_1 /ASSEMBLY_ACC=CAM_ASM_000867 /TAXON_ID=1034604 /ORGANISM="Chlamydomonas leiostraca, Strain SAG 11-49" /LENGTH=352 /DNA_ID=CAMNT_0049554061 /DNA_START=189 /DNA_END=1247 /DNA_ORIENTATION=+
MHSGTQPRLHEQRSASVHAAGEAALGRALELPVRLGAAQRAHTLAAEPEGQAAGEAAPGGAAAGVVLVDVQPQVLPPRGAHAEVEALVVGLEVLPVHPERAVIGGPEVERARHLWVLPPQRAVVAPRALPLKGCPGVAQAHQPEPAHLLHRLDGVRVALHDAVDVLRVVAAARGRGDHGAPARVEQHRLEHLVGAQRVLGGREHHVRLGAAAVHQVVPLPQSALHFEFEHVVARECLQRPQRGPAIKRCVGALELGHGLLQQQHPRLVAVGLSEDGAAAGACARHPVVDDNVLPLLVAAVKQPDLVLSVRRVLAREEAALHRALLPRQARARAHEPAVAQLALADVAGVDVA